MHKAILEMMRVSRCLPAALQDADLPRAGRIPERFRSPEIILCEKSPFQQSVLAQSAGFRSDVGRRGRYYSGRVFRAHFRIPHTFRTGLIAPRDSVMDERGGGGMIRFLPVPFSRFPTSSLS